MAAFERSRLTQKKFAAQAGIGYSTLTLWLSKAASRPKPAKSAFVPVANLFSASPMAPAYRLQFPQGMVVEVTPGFQSEELATLLQLVQTL